MLSQRWPARVTRHSQLVRSALILLLAAVATLAPASPVLGQGTGCQFILGFATLRDLLGAGVAGDCVEDQHFAANGDAQQQTTKGLLAWRKADNWTAFTDGFRSWVNGPLGVQQRLNTERFPWEADAGAPGTTTVSGGFDPAKVAVRLEPVARGLAAPVDVVTPPDGSGRLFVVEKRGTIRAVAGGSVSPAPFLNITSLVRSSGEEQGLLGLAFHPKYAQNGFFYVNYTDTRGDTMVVRYTAASRDAADPNSAVTLLHIAQPAANHNGGNLTFGSDGYLYVGTGDGGGAGDTYRNSQNMQSLLAKMLRLDVDRTAGGNNYAIPPDNPFVGSPTIRPEIWAYGFRNPWRYSFDRATGDLYIGDVGQDRYEEIDVHPAGVGGGQNYGWNRMEGLHCFSPSGNCDQGGLTMPVAEYPHSEGCSITGGYVYRGKAYPMLAGAYLFGDYCSGRIWTLAQNAAGAWVRTEQLKANVNVSSFGEDAEGEVYVTGLNDGTLYHVAATAR